MSRVTGRALSAREMSQQVPCMSQPTFLSLGSCTDVKIFSTVNPASALANQTREIQTYESTLFSSSKKKRTSKKKIRTSSCLLSDKKKVGNSFQGPAAQREKKKSQLLAPRALITKFDIWSRRFPLSRTTLPSLPTLHTTGSLHTLTHRLASPCRQNK